jgi:hypothetical protein
MLNILKYIEIRKCELGENNESQYVASIPWSGSQLAEMFARPEQL